MGRLYRTLTYYTFKGLVQAIDLGDIVYGEWIVYNNNIPEFYVCTVDENLANKKINQLITTKAETIETIILKINKSHGLRLSLSNSEPKLKILKKTELLEWRLKPLPTSWLESI